MSRFYDRQGHPIGVERWAQLFEDAGYQQIKKTQIDGVTVSTIWLGLDHNWGMNESGPLIFETMIFSDGWDNLEEYRYETEEGALLHHDELVDELELLRGATS